MSLTFYYGSGSPYAWRVWLALEHTETPYEWKLMSFSAGDLQTPEFAALNPRRKVPVIVDDGFALYESAAILEYLEERRSAANPSLFPGDARQRAVVRRLVREADEYIAHPMEALVGEILFTDRADWNADVIRKARDELAHEFPRWEEHVSGNRFLTGAASAADFTLYPLLALIFRMERSHKELALRTAMGPKLAAWMGRVEALPYFARTRPPHWIQS